MPCAFNSADSVLHSHCCLSQLSPRQRLGKSAMLVKPVKVLIQTAGISFN